MKALETPEEKRARRLKKKEEKEKRKRAEMGWDQEMMVTIRIFEKIINLKHNYYHYNSGLHEC